MQIDLTSRENEYLKHVLDTARQALLHALRHTHGQEFKDALKHQLDLNEKVLQKVEPAAVRR
jgi:hypothetical protein